MPTERTRLAGGQPALLKNASDEIRLAFVRKVYGILTAQLLLTFAIAAPIVISAQSKDVEKWQEDNSWMYLLALIGMITMMCALCCCQSVLRTYPTNYIFLFLFTAAEGLFIGYVSALYTWQSVLLALGITAGIFFAMTVLAWTTTIDFTGYGIYLRAALCTFFVFGLVLMIMGACGVNIDGAMMFYNFLGVLLFTFYIVYDTQLILGAYGGHKVQFSVDDYCFAALSLYLDIINLFLHLLSLLGQRR